MSRVSPFRSSFRFLSAGALRGTRAGALMNRIQLHPGKWEFFADQTRSVSREFAELPGIKNKGIFYGAVNLGTLPGSDHTNVVSFALFDTPSSATSYVEFRPQSREKLAGITVQPPQRLVSDAVFFEYDDLSSSGHEATPAVSVATIGVRPGLKEDLLRHLENTPIYPGVGSVWMGALSQRSRDQVSLLIAYRSFKAAFNAIGEGRDLLEGLTPFAQTRPAGFTIHEWSRLYSQ
eukprot:c34254_g1_i1.p1 GENE.c34254_g1_i1~~c34254_g1_i1.p1  ORF type:complete len:234 (+),score=31.75 c34254_g1_i1:42-743(+)